jgi:predicted GTPase
VLAVEDGPTLTHGEMAFGAAALAAREAGAEVVAVLPAMGYGAAQVEELRETIARSDADVVLVGTPVDLRRLIELDKPALRVTYRLEERGEPTLETILADRGLLGPAVAAA